jgi:hypothetical protein
MIIYYFPYNSAMFETKGLHPPIPFHIFSMYRLISDYLIKILSVGERGDRKQNPNAGGTIKKDAIKKLRLYRLLKGIVEFKLLHVIFKWQFIFLNQVI